MGQKDDWRKQRRIRKKRVSGTVRIIRFQRERERDVAIIYQCSDNKL